MRKFTIKAATALLLPQLAWASDYSGLMPLYVGVVVLVGGFAAGFEWMLINAFMGGGKKAGEEDREAQDKARFGCGLAAVLWAVNSLVAHMVILSVWG